MRPTNKQQNNRMNPSARYCLLPLLLSFLALGYPVRSADSRSLNKRYARIIKPNPIVCPVTQSNVAVFDSDNPSRRRFVFTMSLVEDRKTINSDRTPVFQPLYRLDSRSWFALERFALPQLVQFLHPMFWNRYLLKNAGYVSGESLSQLRPIRFDFRQGVCIPC